MSAGDSQPTTSCPGESAATPAGDQRANSCDAEKFDLAVIGGGPAGCGMLCCAATSGKLDSLLDRGLVLLEADSDPERLGGGAFAEYGALRSNSHGSAFHESFPALGLKPHDPSLDVAEVIPLSGLHKSMCQIGGYLRTVIEAHPRGSVRLGARVVEVREIVDGSGSHSDRDSTSSRAYEIVYESVTRRDGSKRVKRSVFARNVCLCTGGQPKVPNSFSSKAGSKAQRAFDFLRGVLPKPALKSDGSVPSVAIVGYSHTAFSMALLWRKWFGKDAKIAFVTRGATMPRIYFPSQAEARAINYEYDPENDVCHATDRVFRFSGLRGDQRDFALSEDFKKFCYTAVLGDSKKDFDESHFDHVIVATGFELNPNVKLKSLDGSPLVPGKLDNGTFVSETGRLFESHRIFAFGLGAGLLPTEDLGGEASSRTKVRSDGVWLYQNTVGETILKSIES